MVFGWMLLLLAVDGMSNGLVEVFAGLASFLLSLAMIVIAVSVIFLAGLFIRRVWKLGHTSHLVVEPLVNATGNSDLDKLLPGLNQGVRETLATSLQAMCERTSHIERSGCIDSINQIASDDNEVTRVYALLPRSHSRYPAPEAAITTRLASVLTALGVGNGGRARIAERLVGLLMAPRGTRVVITLQRRSDALSGAQVAQVALMAQVGVSVEVLDVEGRHAPVLRTFWDEAGPDGNQLQPLTTTVLAAAAAEPLTNTTAAANGSGGKRTSTAAKTTVAKLAQLQVAQALDESRQQDWRYRALLRCAALWLAGEVASRALLLDEGRVGLLHLLFKRRRVRADRPLVQAVGQAAVMYNAVGYFHLAAALTSGGFPDFYSLAVREFQRAIALNTQWYQPYENLADSYVMWAQALMTQQQPGQAGSATFQLPAGNRAKSYLYEALTSYDEAMRLFDQQEHILPAVEGEKYGDEENAGAVERSIQLGKYTALLMLGGDENTKRALRGIKFLRGNQWTLEAEKDGFLLYALARWYALADLWQLELPDGLTLPDASARQAACRYLAYSLTRERRLWVCAAADPCFASLFSTAAPGSNWEQLLLALTRKNYETRASSQGAKELATLVGKEFEEAIINALSEYGA